MSEHTNHFASTRQLLEFILKDIDQSIENDAFLIQHYRSAGDKSQAIRFKDLLTKHSTARSFIVRELEKCDDGE